jgi:hypothetical protein
MTFFSSNVKNRMKHANYPRTLQMKTYVTKTNTIPARDVNNKIIALCRTIHRAGHEPQW